MSLVSDDQEWTYWAPRLAQPKGTMEMRGPLAGAAPPAIVRRTSSLPVEQRSRLRFRPMNLAMTVPIITTVGVLLIALEAPSWRSAIIPAVGLAAALVAFERWTAGRLLDVGVPCLLIAAGTWAYGAFTTRGGVEGGFYPLTVVAGLLVPELTRRRIPVAVAIMGYVGLVGLIGMMLDEPSVNGLVKYLLAPVGATAILLGVMVPNRGFYETVAQIERDGERETELAVMRERVRIAGDLHDIQGHTLHVVKLKVALAQRLLRSNPERADEELREVATLIGQTISQARELAYGERRVNLAMEVENAKNLFEAAGIVVRIDGQGEAEPDKPDLVGQVLREATTNILRHSRAALVRITLRPHGIEITNDGAPDGAAQHRRGLATLERRVAEAGGVLTVQHNDGHFLTAVDFVPAGDLAGDHSGSEG